ncbi:sterol desaturase family protein [Tardiphaga alba]|uniref:Sterol desaturase family protein n=1 Tax=Tardiphaga alba TaxID=340268 RepID=A0ABX8A6J0_9BRAD|nr:sterol desaturase family protein [Tardiphaga alba]QUS39268.1 sterol desaturase family protein [Tardiphaga alba]
MHHQAASYTSPAYLLSFLWWPLLYFGALAGAWLAFASDQPILWFNLVYVTLFLSIILLERVMPHRAEWLDHDGETLNDIGHTLLTKGAAQLAVAATSIVPMAVATLTRTDDHASHLWPSDWPLIAQVVLAVVIAEFGLYWSHRIAHENLFLWRFHALHHSVIRLWVVNTGRFHVIDTLIKVVLSQGPLYLLDAPLQVFLWVGAVTAITGLLTHCNVETRTALFDPVFATPKLHRWHHSKTLKEGNSNYGENVMIWDHVFGTYLNPDKASPDRLGISGKVAPDFIGQIMQPFSRKGGRQILGQRVESDEGKSADENASAPAVGRISEA